MKTVRKIGGYDMEFMEGLCFEDDDFVIRMWNEGADILFCDDIHALHIEHPRAHLEDHKRIERNRKLFIDRYGDLDYLKNSIRRSTKHSSGWIWNSVCGMKDEWPPGLAIWSHENENNNIRKLVLAQRMYGHGKNWVAIPADEVT